MSKINVSKSNNSLNLNNMNHCEKTIKLLKKELNKKNCGIQLISGSTSSGMSTSLYQILEKEER